MSAPASVPRVEGGIPGVGVGLGTINAPNMVAEPGAQLPIGTSVGGMIGGGQQVPIPAGGTPEVQRGRRARVDSRSRSSGTRGRTQTPLQREPSMNVNPLIFGPQQAPQQAPPQAPQQAQPQAPQQAQQQHNF